MKLLSDYTVRIGKGLVGFVTEPTVNGGRNRVENYDSPVTKSNSYAQELAPIPLSMTPAVRQSGSARKGRLSGQDIEPFFHTFFCNELLFQPRVLHNCDRDTVVLRVEMREIEWKDGFGYLAHLPEYGASIHNRRRGPFLVSDSFTTCVARRRPGEHQFIDEFKTKLPLDLAQKRKDGSSRSLTLFFTVYGVKLNSSSTLNPTTDLLAPADVGEESRESTLMGSKTSSCMEQISCGFLPLSNANCLVYNGIHNVQVTYRAETAPKTLREQWGWPTTTLRLVERKEGKQSVQPGAKYDAGSSFVNHERVSVRDRSNNEPISLSVSLIPANIDLYYHEKTYLKQLLYRFVSLH